LNYEFPATLFLLTQAGMTIVTTKKKGEQGERSVEVYNFTNAGNAV